MELSILRLSIIIPAWNEAANIAPLLRHLQMMNGVDEIIVSDGGSVDDTVRLAQENGATVVKADVKADKNSTTFSRNRGAQLNAGARIATGAVLWFLHADVRPHPDSVLRIKRALEQPLIVGGNFRLHFKANGFAARLFEKIARAQRRWGIYYGDSGIFLRREVFEALGGYREWPLFEDYDLARRLERYAPKYGCRTVYFDLPIIVSPRRFRNKPLRTLLLWLTLQALFSLGVSPHRLARLYHGARGGGQ